MEKEKLTNELGEICLQTNPSPSEAFIEYLKDIFKNARLPHPIIQSAIKVNAVNRSNNFFVDSNGRAHFLYDPAKKKMYASANDVKKDYNSFTIIRSMGYSHCFSSSYTKYVKELDTMVYYEFFVNKDGELQIKTITLYPRKNKYSKNVVMFPMKDVKDDSYFNFNSIGDHTDWSKCSYFKGPLCDNESFIHAVKKMYGTNFMCFGVNKYSNITDRHTYRDFLDVKESFKKKNTKTQAILDELNDHRFKDVQIKPDDFKRYYHYGYCSERYITKLERISDDTLCIRYIVAEQNCTTQTDILRVFIKNGEVYACKRNSDAEFVNYAISRLACDKFSASFVRGLDKETVKGTMFEPYIDSIAKVSPGCQSSLIFALINEPLVKVLYDNGFTFYVKNALESTIHSNCAFVPAIASDIGVGKKDKDLSNACFTDWQLKEIAKEFKDEKTQENFRFKIFKNFFGRDAKSFDEADFKKILPKAVAVYNENNNYINKNFWNKVLSYYKTDEAARKFLLNEFLILNAKVLVTFLNYSDSANVKGLFELIDWKNIDANSKTALNNLNNSLWAFDSRYGFVEFFNDIISKEENNYVPSLKSKFIPKVPASAEEFSGIIVSKSSKEFDFRKVEKYDGLYLIYDSITGTEVKGFVATSKDEFLYENFDGKDNANFEDFIKKFLNIA